MNQRWNVFFKNYIFSLKVNHFFCARRMGEIVAWFGSFRFSSMSRLIFEHQTDPLAKQSQNPLQLYR